MNPHPISEDHAPDVALRLGWVSFFNDAASHVLARILPLFLTGVLGVSATFVGVVEGLAEGLAVFTKTFSGWLSDRAASRKKFVFGGYALSFLARVCYLLTFSPLVMGLSRVLDRVGKGLRCPARDAMVADAALFGKAGRAFGITSRLDALGAFAGISVVLWVGVGQGSLTLSMFRLCVWIALPLGIIALLIMVFAVPRVPRISQAPKLSWQVPREIRGFLLLVFLFSLANSSDAFLVLRAAGLGYGVREMLALFLGFNLIAALLAVPVGQASDRFGRVPFLAVGWLIYAVSYGAFAYVQGRIAFAVVLLAYGSFYGFTEGVMRALLADLLPPEKRGMGFGSLQLTLGLATLLASPIMGAMLNGFGPKAAFLVTSGTAMAAVVGLALWGIGRSHRKFGNVRNPI